MPQSARLWCGVVVSRADGIPCILPASAHYAAESMVAQAGQPPGQPVSCEAGILTPVWAIAIERENSGDSVICYSRRLPSWLQPLPPHTLNLSLCLRLSVAQTVIPVSVLRTVAGDERSARRSLVRDMCSPLLPVCR